jgi:alpha-1,3-rhamnosyltransferase
MSEINEKNPLVSVVVPCYNHEGYVKECIQSIIDQSYKNIELIVIDDGSKDASVAVIEGLRGACEERFTRFEFNSRENRGLCNTLNQALDWCQGEYFAAIASDDQWLPFKTEKQVEYLELHPKVIAVFGGVILIDENGSFIRKVEKTGSFEFRDILLNKHFLPAPTALVRRLELQAIGYDPSIKIEDWNVWLKLSKYNEARLDSLGDAVALYRKHQSNMSGDAEMMHEQGMKILAQFADDANYKQAVAEYELAMSAALAFQDKRRSVRFYFAYLNTLRYSPRAFPVLIKILTPTVLSRFVL